MFGENVSFKKKKRKSLSAAAPKILFDLIKVSVTTKRVKLLFSTKKNAAKELGEKVEYL